VPIAQEYSSFFGVYYIGNQYTPANEPDLWAPWYYDWLGQPWKTQKVARSEMAVYNPRPDGMPGNDDTGEMSAWYVLAALGIYHVTPGVDAWELSSPAFPSVVVHEGSTRRLRIDAPGASKLEPYVHGVRLNGAPISRTFLTSCELRGGGELSFALGAVADRSWGTARGAAPPSASAPSGDVDGCAARLAAGTY
jgi:putative alpha-1,2-mannosidase